MIRSVSLLLVGCLLADPVAASIQGIVPPAPAPGHYTPASQPSLYNEQALEPFLNWMRNPLEWDAIRELGSSIARAAQHVTDWLPQVEVVSLEIPDSNLKIPLYFRNGNDKQDPLRSSIGATKITTSTLRHMRWILKEFTNDELYELGLKGLHPIEDPGSRVEEKLNIVLGRLTVPSQIEAVRQEMHGRGVELVRTLRDALEQGQTYLVDQSLDDQPASLHAKLLLNTYATFTDKDPHVRSLYLDALAALSARWWDDQRAPRDAIIYIIWDRLPVSGRLTYIKLLIQEFHNIEDVEHFLFHQQNPPEFQKELRGLLTNPREMLGALLEEKLQTPGSRWAPPSWPETFLLSAATHGGQRWINRLIRSIRWWLAHNRISPPWLTDLLKQLIELTAHPRNPGRKDKGQTLDGGTWWWMTDFYEDIASVAGDIVGWIITPFLVEGLSVWLLGSGFLHLVMQAPFTTDNSYLLWMPLLAWLAGHMGNPKIFSQRDRNLKEFLNPWRWAIALQSIGAYFIIGHFTHGPINFGIMGLIIGVPHLVILSYVKHREWKAAQATRVPEKTKPAKPANAKTAPASADSAAAPTPTPATALLDYFAAHHVARKFPAKLLSIERKGLALDLTDDDRLWFDGADMTESMVSHWEVPKASWQFAFFGNATPEEVRAFRRAIAPDMALLGQPPKLALLKPERDIPPSPSDRRWHPIPVGYQPVANDPDSATYQWMILKNQGLVCLWTAFQAAVNSQDESRKRWLYAFLKEFLQLPKDVPNEALDPSITLLRGFWEEYVKATAAVREQMVTMTHGKRTHQIPNLRSDALVRLHIAVNRIDPILYRMSLHPPTQAQTRELDPQAEARIQALQVFNILNIDLTRIGWDWQGIYQTLLLGLNHEGDIHTTSHYEEYKLYLRLRDTFTHLHLAHVVTAAEILNLIQLLAQYEKTYAQSADYQRKLKSKLSMQVPSPELATDWPYQQQKLDTQLKRLAYLINSDADFTGQPWLVLSQVSVKNSTQIYYAIIPVKKDWTIDPGRAYENIRIVAEDDPWFEPFLHLVGKPVASKPKDSLAAKLGRVMSLVLSVILFVTTLIHSQHPVPAPPHSTERSA